MCKIIVVYEVAGVREEREFTGEGGFDAAKRAALDWLDENEHRDGFRFISFNARRAA